MSIKEVVENYFKRGQEKGGMEFIFTLVRVEGLSYKTKDPFIELKQYIQEISKHIAEVGEKEVYEYLVNQQELLSLLANLLNCIIGKSYDLRPFSTFYHGTFPNITPPSTKAIIEKLISDMRAHSLTEIAEELDNIYGHRALSEKLFSLQSFIKSILAIYDAYLKGYIREPKYYKLPQFDVLELLVDDSSGLYGFKVHHSNGTNSSFIRTNDSTEPCNISFGDGVEYFVGDLSQLKKEWYVGSKRLYELGLEGRYNKYGEWKPIVYPNDPKDLEAEIFGETKDTEVQGILFYVKTTCYWAIEFIIKTNIDIPMESISVGSNIVLCKCSALGMVDNCLIYDCTYKMDSLNPKEIRRASNTIAVFVNRLSFAYGVPATYFLKYRMVEDMGRPCASPSKDDLSKLDTLLKDFPHNEDSVILDIAIDWYNLGRNSKHTFIEYLCYYIAIECVATNIADGHVDLGIKYDRGTKKERRNNIEECIKDYHSKHYEEDPIQFVNRAYSECVHGIKRKMKKVLELVFGEGHKYLDVMFEDADAKKSLTKIRGDLAHGDITRIGGDFEKEVKERVSELQTIAEEFIARLIFSLKPSDSVPKWSNQFKAFIKCEDPRNTLCVGNSKMIEDKNWKINHGWCN